MSLPTRQEALASGEKKYAGRPCKDVPEHNADGPAARYLSNGKCVKCQIAQAKAHQLENPEAQAAYRRKYHLENPEKSREASRRSRGYPEPPYPAPDACECCGKTVEENGKALALDHCHDTNEFRGWLCNNCNTAIGKLGDNLPGVMRAAGYLRGAAKKAYLRSEE